MVISLILHEGVAVSADAVCPFLLTVLSDPVPAMSSDESVRFSELSNNVPATTSNESLW